MQADPRVGIELPLRMLIWQDPDGTHVGYLDPRELADRYALDGHQQTLERQTAVLTQAGRRGGGLSARPPDPVLASFNEVDRGGHFAAWASVLSPDPPLVRPSEASTTEPESTRRAGPNYLRTFACAWCGAQRCVDLVWPVVHPDGRE
jgi:hypothetical protein